MIVIASVFLLSAAVATEPEATKELPRPKVTVKTVDVDQLAARIESLTPDEGLELHTGAGRSVIAPADLVRLDFEKFAPAESMSPTVWTLINGDRLLGQLADATEEGMVIDAEGMGSIVVPLEQLASVDMPTAGTVYRESSAWFHAQPMGGEDEVLLTNGDVLRGFVSDLSPSGLVMETAGGETDLARRLLVSLRLAPMPSSPAPKPSAIVHLGNGARLSVAAVRYQFPNWQVSCALGRQVHIAEGQVRSIDFVGGRWHHLSDRTPELQEHTPMLSIQWPVVCDANVLGQPLTVSGRVYRKGIGVHSASRLVYALDEKDGVFVTCFGLDDDSGPAADVSVVIRTDGVERFRRDHVTSGALHGPVRVTLDGARRLELVVLFGDNGAVQDRFDWIEPAIVR